MAESELPGTIVDPTAPSPGADDSTRGQNGRAVPAPPGAAAGDPAVPPGDEWTWAAKALTLVRDALLTHRPDFVGLRSGTAAYILTVVAGFLDGIRVTPGRGGRAPLDYAEIGDLAHLSVRRTRRYVDALVDAGYLTQGVDRRGRPWWALGPRCAPAALGADPVLKRWWPTVRKRRTSRARAPSWATLTELGWAPEREPEAGR